MSYGHLINDYIINIIDENIDVKYSSTRTENYILNESLRNYLVSIKKEIDKVYDKWDKYKRITNKYEYINTIVNHDFREFSVNTSVCSYKPISRSYFKLIEILNIFNLEWIIIWVVCIFSFILQYRIGTSISFHYIKITLRYSLIAIHIIRGEK